MLADDPLPVVVIDAGHSEWRAGHSFDDGPASVNAGLDVNSSSNSSTILVGKVRDALNELEVETSMEYALLLSVPVRVDAKRARELADAIFSDPDFAPQALMLSSALLLSLYHISPTALIVDMGKDEARIFCVYEGHSVLSLQTEKYALQNHAVDSFAVAVMVADAAAASGDEHGDEAGSTPPPSPSLPMAILATVGLVDVGLHAALLSNVVLIGGGSLAEGIVESIRSELESELKARGSPFALKVTAKGDRRLACWLGGATLAMTSAGASEFVTREEYTAIADENTRAARLQRRCTTLGGIPLDQMQASRGVEKERDAIGYAEARRAARQRAEAAATEGRRWWEDLAPHNGSAARARQRHLQRHVVDALYQGIVSHHLFRSQEHGALSTDRRGFAKAVPQSAALSMACAAMQLVHACGGVASMPSNAAVDDDDEAEAGVEEDEEALLSRRLRHALVACWASSMGYDAATISRCDAIAHSRAMGRRWRHWRDFAAQAGRRARTVQSALARWRVKRCSAALVSLMEAASRHEKSTAADDRATYHRMARAAIAWLARASQRKRRGSAASFASQRALGAGWRAWVRGSAGAREITLVVVRGVRRRSIVAALEQWRAQRSAQRLLRRIVVHFASLRFLKALVWTVLLRRKDAVLIATAVCRHSRHALRTRYWPAWAAWAAYHQRLERASMAFYPRTMAILHARCDEDWQRLKEASERQKINDRYSRVAGCFAREYLRRDALVAWRVEARILRTRYAAVRMVARAKDFHLQTLRRHGWRAWRRYWSRRRLGRARDAALDAKGGDFSRKARRKKARRFLASWSSDFTTARASFSAPSSSEDRLDEPPPRSPQQPLYKKQDAERELRLVLAEGRRWAERLVAPRRSSPSSPRPLRDQNRNVISELY